MERQKSIHLRSWENPKQNKLKDIINSWKQPENNYALFIGEHLLEWQQTSHLKSLRPDGSIEAHFKSQQKKKVSCNFCIWWNNFRNEGEIKIFSDEGKLKEYVTNRPTVKRFVKWTSSNRKERVKERILEHQEGRKNNRKSRDMGIYNRLSFSSWALQITFNNQDRNFYTI